MPPGNTSCSGSPLPAQPHCWCLPPSQGGPHKSEGFRTSSGWKARKLGFSPPHLLTVESLATCFSLPWCRVHRKCSWSQEALQNSGRPSELLPGYRLLCWVVSLRTLGPWASSFWVSGSILTSTNLKTLDPYPDPSIQPQPVL